MAIEGGKRGPNRSPNIFLAIETPPRSPETGPSGGTETNRRPVRPPGERCTSSSHSQTAPAGPAERVTAPAGRYVMRTCTHVGAYRGDRSPGSTANSYGNVPGDVRRSSSRSRRRSTDAPPAGAAYRDVNAQTGPSKDLAPVGRTPSSAPPQHWYIREDRLPNDAAGPHAAAARRLQTGMSIRYTPRPRFKNLLGLLPRLPAWRHAPPIRRLRVRHRCPRAAMSTGSRRSARAACSPGGRRRGDANKISPFAMPPGGPGYGRRVCEAVELGHQLLLPGFEFV